MTLTMTKLGTQVPNQRFKPKCGSSSKNESLQCLKCECADPWKHAATWKGSNVGTPRSISKWGSRSLGPSWPPMTPIAFIGVVLSANSWSAS